MASSVLVVGLLLCGTAAGQMQRSSTFCKEDDDAPLLFPDGSDNPMANCYPTFQSEKSGLPPCTTSSGTTRCLCPAVGENVFLTERCDLADSSYSATSYCQDLGVYESSDGTKEFTCSDMVDVQESVDRAKRPSNSRRRGAASYDNGRRRRWWFHSCDSGYTDGFTANECVAKERYAGESCWDGWSSGECQNEGAGTYDFDKLSCVDLPELEAASEADLQDPDAKTGTTHATCVPGVHVYGCRRPQCTCAGDWWFFGWACGANQCNGHVCGPSSLDLNGPKYCDFTSNNDW